MLTSGGGCFLSQKTLTAQIYLINPINLSEAISFSVRGRLGGWVCNRAAVVDGVGRYSFPHVADCATLVVNVRLHEL